MIIADCDSAFQLQQSSLCFHEGELFNLIRNGRGVPAVPLVMVGIQP